MDFARLRGPKGTENLAFAAFGAACLYALFFGSAHGILAGIAFALMVYGALPRQIALACLVGAVVILLVQPRRGEGFESGSGAKEDNEKGEEKEKSKKADTEAGAGAEGEAAEKEKVAAAEEKKAEGFSAGKPMLPDNATRREPLELGKPYRLPNENDDKGFHLDAGTTFLNAYKALKPDQIAAMTRDTQELLATQKSLMTMLDSFAPLMKDMNKITGLFGQQ
jgi:hypothetical protein